MPATDEGEQVINLPLFQEAVFPFQRISVSDVTLGDFGVLTETAILSLML
jgi:hypothetical protein